MPECASAQTLEGQKWVLLPRDRKAPTRLQASSHFFQRQLKFFSGGSNVGYLATPSSSTFLF